MQTKNLSPNQQRINILETALLGVIIALPLWPSYLVIKMEGIPGISLTRILIFQALLLWVFALLINRSCRTHFTDFLIENRNLLLLIMLPFFGWKLVTAGFAPNRMPAVFSALQDTIYCFGLFIMAACILRTSLQVERVVRVLLIISAVIFCVTVLEVINQQNLFTSFVPDSFVSAQRLRESLIRDATYRAWGTFAHPIALAGYCTTVLPLAVWYACMHRDHHRWAGFFVCILLSVTLFLSTSRAGLAVVAFITSGFFVVNYLPGSISRARINTKGFKVITALMMSLVILAGAWFVGQKLATGRTAKESGSSSIRLLQIELGLPLIKARPLTGYGPGNAAEVLGLSAKTVDNYYLSLALESGLPEVILFIFIYFYFLHFAWKLQKKLPNPASGLVVAIFWLVAGNTLFLSVVSLEQTLPFVFMMFGMLISIDSIARKTIRNTI